jgi:hypothetical protein
VRFVNTRIRGQRRNDPAKRLTEAADAFGYRAET